MWGRAVAERRARENVGDAQQRGWVVASCPATEKELDKRERCMCARAGEAGVGVGVGACVGAGWTKLRFGRLYKREVKGVFVAWCLYVYV